MWGLWYTDIKITMVNMLRALLEKVNYERIDEYYKKGYGNSKKELKGNDRNRKTLRKWRIPSMDSAVYDMAEKISKLEDRVIEIEIRIFWKTE